MKTLKGSFEYYPDEQKLDIDLPNSQVTYWGKEAKKVADILVGIDLELYIPLEVKKNESNPKPEIKKNETMSQFLGRKLLPRK